MCFFKDDFMNTLVLTFAQNNVESDFLFFDLKYKIIKKKELSLKCYILQYLWYQTLYLCVCVCVWKLLCLKIILSFGR